ncbi:hypothetical protein [Amycolatopsis sp. lyj-90]|uniref:hypothetical protein n=1 Tax=Amycolatopsis sp. lyj-90 TaxID=2789285 RepID=UPI00397944F0
MINVGMFTNSCQWPAEIVKVDRFIDLPRRQPPSAHLHTVSMENLADRSPVDAEPVTQPGSRGPLQIPNDQRLSLGQWQAAGGEYREVDQQDVRTRLHLAGVDNEDGEKPEGLASQGVILGLASNAEVVPRLFA